MGKFLCIFTIALLTGVLTATSLAAEYATSTVTPPAPEREFRAAWIATVGNIDWPSKKDLSTAEQKAELIAILDRAAKIGLNAVIFQVRPACDALYPSQLEPWSEYLTGAMGKAPEPSYDPLAFAIEEAHKRRLELHAWFNPYRARHVNARSPVSANHISKTKPHLVRQYGSYLWLDPGEREVQQYSLNVVLDVVKRYDIDGVHFDDYFYPYKEAVNGRQLDFPDEASWKKFGAGGKLSREDWRRENVNLFVQRVNQSVKATKPWVKFGVSPFGIWRPGYPPQIKGLDAYDELYADARHWLVNGWVDYLAPQLYWAIEPKEQSFPVLLKWWNEQNSRKRHIWPGMDTTKVRSQNPPATTTPARRNSDRPRAVWQPDEIVAQIRLTETQPVSAGHIHWNARSLLRSAELQSALTAGPYAQPALVPACTWLDNSAPGKPTVKVAPASASAKVTWQNSGTDPISSWVVQFRRGGQWRTVLLPGTSSSQMIDGGLADIISVSAVDRAGNLSRPTSVSLQK